MSSIGTRVEHALCPRAHQRFRDLREVRRWPGRFSSGPRPPREARQPRTTSMFAREPIPQVARSHELARVVRHRTATGSGANPNRFCTEPTHRASFFPCLARSVWWRTSRVWRGTRPRRSAAAHHVVSATGSARLSSMGRQTKKAKTLFAYVDGGDVDESLAAAVETRLDALVEQRKWISKDVWVVNQQEPPHWDLGLNLTLPTKGRWADDVIAIAEALAVLHRETGGRFVIGIHDAASEKTTVVFVVDSDAPDLEKLRAACAKAQP
jgi:hypothetical protein